MRIGVIGSKGRLGGHLVSKGCIPLELDVTEPDTIYAELENKKPSVIVNLASISSPDECEHNPEKAHFVNTRGSYNVINIANHFSMQVVTLSTDHVFNGRTGWDKVIRRFTKRGPYSESYLKTSPVNYYGRTKLNMEALSDSFDNAKVIRTSCCFDYTRLRSPMKTLQNGGTISSPAFLYRSFIHVEHLTIQLMQYLQMYTEMPKFLNLSGSVTVSWYDLMNDISKSFGQGWVSPRIKDDSSYAPRPYRAGLVTTLSKNLGIAQYDYIDGIETLMRELQ